MSDPADCPRVNRWFGHCRFEARYEMGDVPAGVSGKGYGIVEVIEAMKPRIYIRDVCVRCGRTVERATSTDAAARRE